MKIELFYDKECPFCSSYANYIKLKEKHELVLFNARESKDILNEFKNKSFDINDGFIIRINEKKLYQGANAITFLNKLARKKFYFPNNYFFRRIIYTILKKLRIVFLKLIGKKSHI